MFKKKKRGFPHKYPMTCISAQSQWASSAQCHVCPLRLSLSPLGGGFPFYKICWPVFKACEFARTNWRCQSLYTHTSVLCKTKSSRAYNKTKIWHGAILLLSLGPSCPPPQVIEGPRGGSLPHSHTAASTMEAVFLGPSSHFAKFTF